MSFDTLGSGGLDYYPCRYPGSKLMFRGPKRELESPFIAFVGGSETYGKFIEHPFPALLEEELDMPCINFGCMHAGVDLILNDRMLTNAMKSSALTVVQVSSPRNMSNRFYSVHPRRNDRFLKPSKLLKSIYRDVDFSQFNFTKHLLTELRDISSERFSDVVDELQEAWRARMRSLLSQSEGKTVILWMSDHAPQQAFDTFGSDPWFVTQDLIDEIKQDATEYVEVVASKAAREAGTNGMHYSDLEEPAARHALSPLVHQEAAEQLEPVLRRLLA